MSADRRALLALFAASPAAAVAQSAPAAAGGIGLVRDRRALAAYPGDACFLDEGGRSGLFLRRPGPTPADPLEGLHISAATGHWTRHWDGVTGQAEWFGATRDDPAADCAPAIEAALALCVRVQLRPGDYHVRDTLHSRLPGRKLVGAGIHHGDPAASTRIVVASATADVFRMGPDTRPGTSLNSLNVEMLVESIEFDRTVPPSTDARPRGVVVQWCQDPVVRRCKSQDSITDFAWESTINLLLQDCRATRARAGTGAAPDRHVGYHAQTGAAPLTGIGGNASARLHRCIAACTPAVADSTGLLLDGYFTDHSVVEFETAGLATGIRIVGDGAAENRGTDQSVRRNANLEIVRPWIDQFASSGLRVDDLDKFGIVRVSGGYFGPLAEATACVQLIGCRGTVLLGGEMELAMASTAGRQCRGVLAIGTQRLRIGEGVTVMEGTFRAFDLKDVTDLRHAGATVNEAAILEHHTLVTGTADRCVLRPALSGAPSRVARGVTLPSGTSGTTVDLAGISRITLGGATDAARAAVTLTVGDRPQGSGAFGGGNLVVGML